MTEARRTIAPEHIKIIVDRYLRDEGCMVLQEQDNWVQWVCPGCRSATYRADMQSGKAGCANDACSVPDLGGWRKVIAYFAHLDYRRDWAEIKDIGLQIIDQQDQEQRQHEEARRHAEAEELRRRMAHTAEEQQLLDDHRRKQEEHRQQEALAQAEKEQQAREHRHHRAMTRAVAAESLVLCIEVALALIVGMFVAGLCHIGLGLVDPPADGPWGARPDGLVARAVTHRFALDVFAGLSSGVAVLWALSSTRRRHYQFTEHEYLVLYNHGEHRTIYPPERGELSRRELNKKQVAIFVRALGAVPSVLIRVSLVAALHIGLRRRPGRGLMWLAVVTASAGSITLIVFGVLAAVILTIVVLIMGLINLIIDN